MASLNSARNDRRAQRQKKIYVTAKKQCSTVYEDEYGEYEEKVKEKTCCAVKNHVHSVSKDSARKNTLRERHGTAQKRNFFSLAAKNHGQAV